MTHAARCVRELAHLGSYGAKHASETRDRESKEHTQMRMETANSALPGIVPDGRALNPATLDDQYLVRIDQGYTAAWIIGPDGQIVEAYAPGLTRRTAAAAIAQGGWRLSPHGTWSTNVHANGHEHLVELVTSVATA